MTGAVLASQKEKVAERLLGGSVKRQYNSLVDIDWDAPLHPDKYYLPPEIVSLYGTELWDGMTEAQRIELSRQELANVLTVGQWFENILNIGLMRHVLGKDPSSRHVHYALTEVGDETRHMIMFGRMIEKLEIEPYRLDRLGQIVVRVIAFALRGNLLWLAALVGEEIFDHLQRKMMTDPQLQPAVHQLMKIHVTEEARHIRYAREALVRRMKYSPWWEKLFVGQVIGVGGYLMRELLTNPEMYRRAGLNVREARRQVRHNAHVKAAFAYGFEKLLAFMDENKIWRGNARWMWKKAGFIAS
ncbi:diiron oxygenase [Pseudonocardiaceae bacterium YIM PH 21723]|nr:diiron oxygenase [Pseudonocardiaceae bacterium YIM PH 21723]